jgi:tetratricopeptide (TPR) repeat protein
MAGLGTSRGRRSNPLVPFVLLAVLSLPPLVFGQPPLSEDQMAVLQRAFAQQRGGEFALAIESYELLLSSIPPHPDILTNLGAAYAALGDSRNAIRSYEEAVRLNPNHLAARLNLGLAFYKAARPEEAVEQLTEVLRLDPSNSQAVFLLADCHFRINNHEKVLELLTPFRDLAETDRGLAYLLGTALIRTGRVEEGQRYVSVILRRGDSAEAHLMLATARRSVGDLRGAAAEAEKAIEFDPRLPGAHALLGMLLLSPEGIDQVDQVGKNPGLLGEVRIEGGDDRAIEAFRAELELCPNDFDSCFYLGYLLRERDEYEEARVQLEKALRIRPEAYHVAYHLAQLWLMKGEPARARELLSPVVEAVPDFAEAHMCLAAACYRLGLREEGDRHRDAVIELKSGETH